MALFHGHEIGNDSSFWNQVSQKCSFGADEQFGPAISSQCRDFDFTLLFEQAFLSLVPSLIFIISSLIRLPIVINQPSKVRQGRLHGMKLFFAFSYAGLQLALVVLWASSSTPKTKLSLPASIFSFVASMFICLSSHFEHVKSVRPSALLNLYLFFSTLLEIAEVRTLWILAGLDVISYVFTASLSVKAVVLLLEAWEKRDSLFSPYKWSNPESISSIYNRCVFWWLNVLFTTGFQKTLGFDDLFELDDDLASKALSSRAQNFWDRVNKDDRYALIWSMLSCLTWPLLNPAFPRLALIGFNYSQPFLINRIVEYLENKDSSDDDKNVGYGLIAATALIYIGIAVANGRYKHRIYRGMTMMRGALVSLICHKTLELPSSSVEDSASATLMSTDVDSIVTSLQQFHEIWGSTFEVIIGMFLLGRAVGVGSIAPVLFTVAGTILNTFWIGPALSQRRPIWNKAVQQRIAFTSSMLSDAKSLKMLGLTSRIKRLLHAHRIRELGYSKQVRWMIVWMNVSSNLMPTFSAAFVLMTVAIQHRAQGRQPLTSAQAYTILSILNLVASPLSQMLSSIPNIIGCIGCFHRIQTYLLTEGIEAYHMIQSTSNTDRAARSSENIKLEAMPLKKDTDMSDDAIILDHSSFGYSPDTMILHDINIRIRQGSLTMIIGPVASGKTTLLLGLLGELYSDKDKGFVHMNTLNVAYCQQSAWLPNRTVKEIIVGDSEFDYGWYWTVVRACCLDIDISRLSNGIDSVIGSRGLNLSSGQRTRLSLARAVYSRKAIVLLDDVFSDLDAQTEKLVFDRLFSPDGLFRKHRTTIVLATHAVQHLHAADHVVALGMDGTIAGQGSLDMLKTIKGYVNLLTAQSRQTRSKETEGVETMVFRSPSPNQNIPTRSDSRASHTRRKGDFSVYRYYVKHAGYIHIAVFFGLQFSTVTLYKVPQLWVSWWTSDKGSKTDMYIGVMFAFALAAYVTLFSAISLMLVRIMPRTGQSLHWALLSTVCAAPLSFFSHTDSGVILNRFSQDINIIDNHVPIAVMQLFYTISSIIWDGALVCYGSYYITAGIPFLMAIIYGIQTFYLRTSRQLRLLDLELKSPLFTQFTEMKEGLVTIRAFRWQRSFTQQFLQYLDASQRPYYLLYMIQQWLGLCLTLLVAAIAVVLVAFATQFESQSSGSAIGIALINLISLGTSLTNLISNWTDLETSIGAIARLQQLETDVKSEESPRATELPPSTWPDTGAIRYSNVSAQYSNDTPKVLHDINLSINPGEKIGICGRTGSGKSTLISLLFRILPIWSGDITLDGIDLSTASCETVRNSIIAVPQSPYLLSGSVGFNVAPHTAPFSEAVEDATADPEKVTKADIISALERVGLWAVIESRGGLGMSVAEIGLSQGQQQLLCLARAILRKASSSVLVLDETTSSVDKDTDEHMRSIVEQEFSKHTVINVAHRLTSLLGCDRIIVMEDGRIVEEGSPATLAQIEGGWWRRLWEARNQQENMVT